MDLQKEDPKEFIMATFEFIETLVWVMVQPIIGWVMVDLVNVPMYVKLCKQIRKERQEQEILEISWIVADNFHYSIGK